MLSIELRMLLAPDLADSLEGLVQHGCISFEVPGDCVPKGRGRAFVQKHGKAAGRVMVHTPKATRSFEAKVRSYFCEAIPDLPDWRPSPLRCSLSVLSIIREPKSTPKWAREQSAYRWRGKKPDVDNLAKSVADALNGVAWQDDAQIVAWHGFKMEGPRAETRVLIQYFADTERRS